LPVASDLYFAGKPFELAAVAFSSLESGEAAGWVYLQFGIETEFFILKRNG